MVISYRLRLQDAALALHQAAALTEREHRMNTAHMNRRTKIVATLGPASDDPKTIRELIAAGVDVVRLNFSHSTPEDHARRVAHVRAAAETERRDVGILADLQGPKIRIERFKNGKIELEDGQLFTLDIEMDHGAGDENAVAVSYEPLPKDVSSGDVLLLNDGAIRLEVDHVDGSKVVCKVINGGQLSDRKGINRLGGGLSADALTEKDFADIETAVSLGVDFIAVSFPRSGDDMRQARELVRRAGSDAWLVAKIERAEALECLEEIYEASDIVMVARGDLAVEIGDPQLPGMQKRIIATARSMNRPVITATQMMESMISSPIPTRAEVLDVANAVMDGTDAVMLSAESAAGAYPVKAVKAMVDICVGAEQQPALPRMSTDHNEDFEQTDHAIAMATIYTAGNMGAKAIVALTESGNTALLMSSRDARIPIYAMTRHESTRRRMSMVRSVFPIEFTPSSLEGIAASSEAVACLRSMGLVKSGDRVLVTKGDFTGSGGTNSMKILGVPAS